MPQDSSLVEGQSHTLILGVGNTLYGDDGLGVRVAEILAREELPIGVVVEVAGSNGIDLMLKIEDWQRVILIDAVQMGEEPGTWRRFKPEEVKLLAEGQGFSLHESGVASALELAQALGKLPREVIIYGVEPETLEVREELSSSVQSVIPEITQHILEEIWKREMSKKHILIIDDDADQRLTVRLPLEAAGYQVSEARTSNEGLELIKQLKPDLIVLDVMMDTATAGFQVALALHNPDPKSEYKEYRDIPIIMLTAIHTTTPLRFTPDSDFLPVEIFLEKPVDPEVLVAKVKELLPS